MAIQSKSYQKLAVELSDADLENIGLKREDLCKMVDKRGSLFGYISDETYLAQDNTHNHVFVCNRTGYVLPLWALVGDWSEYAITMEMINEVVNVVVEATKDSKHTMNVYSVLDLLGEGYTYPLVSATLHHCVTLGYFTIDSTIAFYAYGFKRVDPTHVSEEEAVKLADQVTPHTINTLQYGVAPMAIQVGDKMLEHGVSLDVGLRSNVFNQEELLYLKTLIDLTSVSKEVLKNLADDFAEWRTVRNIVNCQLMTVKVWVSYNHSLFGQSLSDADYMEIINLSNGLIKVVDLSSN